MILNMAGGGVGLTFKVVGGDTAPVNPSENTIWVNTTEEITSWCFSPQQPSDPTTGMVWFSIGTASPVSFNALKKNGIQVCPVAASHYLNGLFKNVTAKTWKNGTWTDWIIYLYYGGDEFKGLTGGWVASDWNGKGDHYGAAPSLTISDQCMTIVYESYTSSQHGTGMVLTSNDVDVTDYSYLVLRYSGNSTDDGYWRDFGLFDRTKEYWTDANVAVIEDLVDTDTITEVKVNVSTITGSYAVGIGVKGADGVSTTNVYEIRLDR